MSKKAQNIENWLNKFITQPMLSALRSNIISTAANWIKDERFSAKKATMLAVHEADISKMQITKKYRKYYDQIQKFFKNSKVKTNPILNSKNLAKDVVKHFGKKKFELYDIINYIIGKFTPPISFDDNDWEQLVIDIEHLTRRRLDFYIKNPKKNPPTQAQVDKAVEIRERFSGEEVGEIRKKKISLPGHGEPLIVLAELAGLIYLSNKEQLGTDQSYVHDLEPDSRGKYPLLCCTEDRRTLIIIGGRFKVKSHLGSDLYWLVH